MNKTKKKTNPVIALIANDKIGGFMILLGLCIILSLASPMFYSTANITNLMRQSSWYLMIGMGMLMCFITGNIDLSCGSVIGLSGIVAAIMSQQDNPYPVPVTLAVCLLIGLIVGVFNGYMVGYRRMAAFIVTMGMQVALRGCVLLTTGGYPVNNLVESFTKVGTSKVLGIPTPAYIMAVICLITWYILNKTVFGMHVYATGGNRMAATVSGINTNAVVMRVYMIAGVYAAIAGFVLTARLSSGQLTLGTSYEGDAIAGCFIGGASMSGGIGTVFGTISGVLVMVVLTNGMDLLQVNSYWQNVVKGVIIILAVFLDNMRKNKE